MKRNGKQGECLISGSKESPGPSEKGGMVAGRRNDRTRQCFFFCPAKPVLPFGWRRGRFHRPITKG